MSISEKKEQYRQLADEQKVSWGRLAEAVRKLPGYREAKAIFVSPAINLQQIRINSLADGKELITTGPGFKKGLYRLKPYKVKFKDLSFAVSIKGVESFGKQLTMAKLANCKIDFAIGTGSFDQNGGRLGSGSGFFDLAIGLMASKQALTADTKIVGVTGAVMADQLPLDRWDVLMDYLVLEKENIECPGRNTQPALFRDALSEKQIRKNDSLWKFFSPKE